jgi:hypothetical protein
MEFAAVSAVKTHTHRTRQSLGHKQTHTKLIKTPMITLPSFGMDRITLTAARNASSVDIIINIVWIRFNNN